MSLKISARRPSAVRARCIIRGLKMAIAPTQITSEKRYTPRQSAIAAESRAVAGAAWTTALPSVDHKTHNLLKAQEVWS
jgi:hypothetical protein